jgi:hypothetical protein
MSDEAGWKEVLRTAVRLLTFRNTRDELVRFNWRHLALGLSCTWLVGIGRYWDNPRVGLLQHLGIGSVVYVFALALLLFLIVWPLRPKDWTYFRVVTFVSLVSPPAILYAIPVERFTDLDTANSINTWFLAVVAAWRVALLVFYFRRAGALDFVQVITVTLLPLTLIVTTLTLLNLEKVVFDFMGGLGPNTRSGNDDAYDVLFLLTILSVFLFVPAVICYLVLAIHTYVTRRKNKTAE